MQRVLFFALALGAMLVLSVQWTLARAESTNGSRGRQLYMDTGCYQCHGTRGQGGNNAGPKLVPQIPYEALLLQLRNPRDRMPVYTAKVMPDQDVKDIYAYLQTLRKGKTAADIPILSNPSAGTAR